MGIFERTVTVWKNTHRTADNKCEVSLWQFLNAGIEHLPTINYLRQLYDAMVQTYPTNPAASATYEEQYKQGKNNLPLATIGGTFANGGLHDDMLEPTNLIALDLDTEKPRKAARLREEGKEIPNGWVKDWEAIKRKLAQLPFVAYCSLSVGGHGIFVIIPIEDYHRHAEAWESLNYLFKKHLNLTIDPQTKDITRPRFISYDPQPYINENAQVFRIKMPEKRTTIPVRRYSSSPSTTTEEAVRRCVEEIERRSLDITSDYGEWVDIASALFNELGEAGKQYYERISRFYPNANERDINYKWEKNKNRSKVGIGTFFDICNRFGIRYKDSYPEVSLRPALQKVTATAEATPERKCRIINDVPLFPDGYDYMAIYEGLSLPSDFFSERLEAVPF